METLLLLERPGFTPLQSKLASTSAARRSKLWRWILSTHAQSRLIMKNFLTPTYSPISAASSEEIKELTWTSRAVLTRSETHSKQWIRYGAPLFTVLALSWNFITVATWQPSCRTLALDGEGFIKTLHKCGKNISDTLGCASYATFLFLPPFDVICDLLLNRHTATWNLFVLYNKELKYSLEICMVEGSLKAHVFFSKYCPLIAKCIIFRVYTTVIYLKWEEYKLRILKIGWFLKTVWMKSQTSI